MPKPLTAKTADALAAIVTDDLREALARVDRKPREYLIRESLRGLAFESALVALVGAIAGPAASVVIQDVINGPRPDHDASCGRFLRARAEGGQLNRYVLEGRQHRAAAVTAAPGVPA